MGGGKHMEKVLKFQEKRIQKTTETQVRQGRCLGPKMLGGTNCHASVGLGPESEGLLTFCFLNVSF